MDQDAFWNQCYAASEALYHLLGGKQAGLKPMVMRLEYGQGFRTHWFLLTNDGQILDPTREQFLSRPNYEQAVGKGFLTKQPSRKAQQLIDLAQEGI
jgi:hypothetical protein